MQKVATTDKWFVFAQLVLLAGFVYALWLIRDERAPMVMRVPGLCSMIASILIAVVALLQVNNKITMYPTPAEHAALITRGVFAWFRHPMYAGIIWFSFGAALYTGSLMIWIFTAVFYVFFQYKSAYEEKRLTEKFPAYTAYTKKVMKFMPFGLLKR